MSDEGAKATSGAADPGPFPAPRPATDVTDGASTSFFRLSLLANHFPELHGVRVLAILCVLQWHVTIYMLEGGLIRTPAATNFAMRSLTLFFGMDLFFVLSGFLIGMMLMHATAEGKTSGARGMLRFYARRAFRTFPLYYVVLIFLAWYFPTNPIKRANLPYEFVYLTNYRPYLSAETVTMMWGWSLCVEEHFYLAVPVLIAALLLLKSHGARLAVLGGLWASALVVRLGLFFAFDGWTEALEFQQFYLKTHTRYDTLIAGILLAYVHFHFKARLEAWLARRGPQLLHTAVTVGCFFLLMYPHEIAGAKHYMLYRLFCWGTFTSLLYLAGLPVLFYGDGPVKRFLSQRAFLKIATLGYGTYLVHMPLFEHLILPFIRLFVALKWPFALVWTIGLVAMWLGSLALSYVLHLLVEKPALALRDRFVP